MINAVSWQHFVACVLCAVQCQTVLLLYRYRMGRYGLDSSGCVEEWEAGSFEQGNKPTRNGRRYFNVLYSQSEVIPQKFKKFSLSTQI